MTMMPAANKSTNAEPNAKADPRANTSADTDAAWAYVCEVKDIPILGARVIERAQSENIAVFRNSEDKVFALLDRCPHKGGPLSQGIVFGERVACPLHNWNIDLQTGCAVAPDNGCVRSFPIKITDGRVLIDAR